MGRDTLRLPTTPFEDVREMRLREATDDTLANISDDTEASMIGNAFVRTQVTGGTSQVAESLPGLRPDWPDEGGGSISLA